MSREARCHVKRSVALAIHDVGGQGVLVVRRPFDDPELPGVWGLPAASLGPGESWSDAALRAARDKLGVAVDVRDELARGTAERAGHTLEMRLFQAGIVSGSPAVPQVRPGVTQYVEWRWAEDAALEPGRLAGSLCCRLFLETR